MRKERRSRIGSYAISSSMSMRDHRQQPCIICTTFNILAPIYKRLNINNDQDQNSRESDYRAYWLVRNQRILDSLLRERSSIICLQEFWLGNEEFVNMYEKRLGDAGYLNFKLARTNNRGDGDLSMRCILHQATAFDISARVKSDFFCVHWTKRKDGRDGTHGGSGG